MRLGFRTRMVPANLAHPFSSIVEYGDVTVKNGRVFLDGKRCQDVEYFENKFLTTSLIPGVMQAYLHRKTSSESKVHESPLQTSHAHITKSGIFLNDQFMLPYEFAKLYSQASIPSPQTYKNRTIGYKKSKDVVTFTASSPGYSINIDNDYYNFDPVSISVDVKDSQGVYLLNYPVLTHEYEHFFTNNKKICFKDETRFDEIRIKPYAQMPHTQDTYTRIARCLDKGFETLKDSYSKDATPYRGINSLSHRRTSFPLHEDVHYEIRR